MTRRSETSEKYQNNSGIVTHSSPFAEREEAAGVQKHGSRPDISCYVVPVPAVHDE